MNSDVTNKLVTSFDCKQSAVRAVRFNVDGNYCLTCGGDKSLKLWNPHTTTLLKTYSGHGYEVLDAQASSDNSQLCSGGLDKAVILTDVASGKVLRKYRSHAAQVNCVKFNEESTVILSGSLDGTVRSFDCKSRQLEPIQVLDDAKDSVTSLQVSNYEILTGSADGTVRRYDIRNGQMTSDYMGCAVSSVSFTRDGQCMLVSTMNNSLKLIDKDSGEMLNEYLGHKNSDYKLDNCLSQDDNLVLSGSEDGCVYIWNLVEGRVVGKLDHKVSRAVHSLTFHPSQPCLLTAVENKVFVWKDKLPDT